MQFQECTRRPANETGSAKRHPAHGKPGDLSGFARPRGGGTDPGTVLQRATDALEEFKGLGNGAFGVADNIAFSRPGQPWLDSFITHGAAHASTQ